MNQPPAAPPPDWPRKKYQPGGGTPNVFFAVYGNIGELPKLPGAKYRVNGIPPELDISACDDVEQLDSLRSGLEALWQKLHDEQPDLAEEVGAAPQGYLIRGNYEDRADLNDFRNIVGFTTFVLDQGGVGILDLHQIRWWRPDDWRQQIFAPALPVARRHVVTLMSPEEEDGLTWYHTRGMLKFGRPDLSYRNVPAEKHDTIAELFQRLIEHLAAGAVIPDGHKIRMPGLTLPLLCRVEGDADDPDFNNVHVEISEAE